MKISADVTSDLPLVAGAKRRENLLFLRDFCHLDVPNHSLTWSLETLIPAHPQWPKFASTKWAGAAAGWVLPTQLTC